MKKGDSLKQFVTFWIRGRRFGVDIRDVKEINDEMRFTPIFHAGKEIKGYVNIRGQVYIVIDPACILGADDIQIAESTRLILFKPHVGEFLAMIVDKIGDVVNAEEHCIEKFHSDHQELELYSGICKLANDMLLILDARNFAPIVEKMAKQRN